MAEEKDERTLSEKHKDIEFSNQYRIEYIKHLITIAAAIFAFTLTFLKDILGKPLSSVSYKPVLILGWLSLIVSLMAGIAQMRLWASYYVSWAKSFYDEEEKKWRNTVNKRRLRFEYLQIYSFFIGLMLLLIFSSLNIF
jgi:uncharacterized protein YqhQ